MNERPKQNRAQDEPDRYFESALAVADSDHLDYEVRLDMLQRWLSRIAHGEAVRGNRKEVEGAIIALQARSKFKSDTPEEQPQTTTYGGVKRSDLRRYSLRRLLKRLGTVFRR